MKELKGLYRIEAAADGAADDAVAFDTALPKGGSSPRGRDDLAAWGKYLSRGASRLLVHWNSARLERAALAHALRWDGSSELAKQVDIAFEYYLAWLEEVTEIYYWHGRGAPNAEERAAGEGLELLRASVAGLLEELRSRVQFLQARAADIRISGNLEVVADALLQLERDRLAVALLKAIEVQMTQPSRSAAEFVSDVKRIETTFPEVARASDAELKNLGDAVSASAGDRSASVREWIVSRGIPMLANAATQIGYGVAGNVAHGWLIRVLG